MTFAGLFAIAILIMRLFPATPAARWLHLHLVELPMAWAAQVERRHMWFLLLLILFAQAASALPIADAAAMGLWDLATYVDAITVTFAAALLGRARWLLTAMRTRLPRLKRPEAARARRPQVRRRERPANDDDGDGRSRLRRAA